MAAEAAGLLLAGGLARRMGGGDKGLKPLGGRPILAHILERVRPQLGPMAINANGDPARFAEFGLPVVPDALAGNPGPLAGVLTGMEWARAHAPQCAYVVTVPTDAPFLPRDLVPRLFEAMETAGADMACAASGGRTHPVVGLWPVALAEDLRRAMTVEEIRKVDRWTGRHRLATAAFETDPADPFFNVNSPDDLAEAEALLARG
jgi:molybdopterin-guanine dinucleotide biosynthesis protein A